MACTYFVVILQMLQYIDLMVLCSSVGSVCGLRWQCSGTYICSVAGIVVQENMQIM